MKRTAYTLGLALLGLGAAGLLSAYAHRADAAAPVPAAPGATPVLVELFTSEGCSSCPAADVVATRLERTQPVAGARILVLAHHVDYWNQLGWPDPWSSSAASARQRSYAPLKSGSYTPQAVVDGRSETVGSRQSALETMIAESAKTTHVSVAIDVAAAGSQLHDVTVRTTPPPDTDLLLAVVQDRGKVAVPAGENAGRTLEHTSIVRSLVSAVPNTKTRVTVPSAINAPDGTTFSVVAFVQERTSRKIVGANAKTL